MPKKNKPTGASSTYYKLPDNAKDIDDLIVHKDMPWHLANIFKACYRYGEKRGTTKLYDLRKIQYFVERAIAVEEKKKSRG